MTHQVDADARIPADPSASPDTEEDPSWDYQCGFVDERTVIAGTRDHEQPQHWLVDTAHGKVLGQVKYPMPIMESPMALGDGTWLTCGEDPFQLHLWSLSRCGIALLSRRRAVDSLPRPLGARRRGIGITPPLGGRTI